MKKPGDVTKKVLKKSTKYIVLKSIISILYRGIAMLTPILFSKAVDFINAGNFERALYISVAALIIVIVFRIFDILNTY